MNLEDETGVINVVVFEKLFDIYRKEILHSRLLMVEGKLQKEGEVIHVIVHSCHDYSKLLRKLTPARKENLPLLTLSRGDEKGPAIPSYPGSNKRTQVREKAQEIHFPEARNFR